MYQITPTSVTYKKPDGQIVVEFWRVASGLAYRGMGNHEGVIDLTEETFDDDLEWVIEVTVSEAYHNDPYQDEIEAELFDTVMEML